METPAAAATDRPGSAVVPPLRLPGSSVSSPRLSAAATEAGDGAVATSSRRRSSGSRPGTASRAAKAVAQSLSQVVEGADEVTGGPSNSQVLGMQVRTVGGALHLGEVKGPTESVKRVNFATPELQMNLCDALCHVPHLDCIPITLGHW